MHVVPHASPLALEEELLVRVTTAKSEDPLAPVLLVVPSRRLADHVARRLVERLGAVLGVTIVHHAALAARVLESAGLPVPRLLDGALVDTLTRRVVRRAPSGRLREFVRERPGALAALLRPLEDLREAGLTPTEVRRHLAPEHAELAALYAPWVEALDEARSRGAADHASAAELATPHAPAFAARFRTILHHGAYELIGVHDGLVRALDRGCPVVFLLPSPREAPAPLPVEASFVHAQGASAELTHATRGALAAVAAGTPPHEVAVIARSFGPYAAAMDALLDADETVWHTSYAQPLRRDPAVGDVLRAFQSSDPERAATFAGHAAVLERMSVEVPALATLARSLADVETILGETGAVPRTEAAAWLTSQADAATVPPARASESGIRILDAMQARGLTFRHVALIGMNAGIFPHVGREDPFLPDAARARLMEKTGRPLPLASRRDAEEHLILGMTLGAARDRLAISWRRADESGRPVVPSLALRGIVRGEAGALPAHPRFRLAAWAARPGLLRRGEEALLIALESESGGSTAPQVRDRLPRLAAGIELVIATDAFGPGDGRYDGRVGSGFAAARLAATALDRLGACPLQFFFKHVLRVRAEPEPETPFEVDRAAVGRRVHDALRDVYRALVDESAFALPAAARLARAKELLPDAWRTRGSRDDAALAARFPLLNEIAEKRWLATLEAFVKADLERLESEGLVPVAVEMDVDKPVPGRSDGLAVTARYDRIARGAGGAVVGDYKTGGDLLARTKAAAMLSAERLQVPLYALLEDAPVELLGVGFRHVPRAGEKRDPRFARFDGFTPDQRAGMIETLQVLAALHEAGRFPLRAGDHCDHCDYAPACRRHHPPTEHREAIATDAEDIRDCWVKNAKTPTLAGVRAART